MSRAAPRRARASRVTGRSEHRKGRAALRLASGLACAFLERIGGPCAEVSLLVTTDRRIRRLNRTWRGVDAATDVLSFPAARVPGAPKCFLGDIVLSLDTARRSAREDHVPVARELARYLAHGLLHLLGYDHGEPRGAARMARAERRLLGAGGMLAEGTGRGKRNA